LFAKNPHLNKIVLRFGLSVVFDIFWFFVTETPHFLVFFGTVLLEILTVPYQKPILTVLPKTGFCLAYPRTYPVNQKEGISF
jgi:hypothetical protein